MTIVWKSKRVLIGIALFIAGLMFLSVSQATQIADRAFSWNPEAISISGKPGETVSFSVEARAGSVLAQTFCPFGVETFAKLSDNLSASMVSVGIVPAKVCGKKTTLSGTLSLSPSAEPRLIDGNIRLYRKAVLFGRTVIVPILLAEPLPISLSIETSDDGLPPDPGEAGKATLEGIDSNGNGVRDDIEQYIAITYPGDAKRNVRKALEQDAKGFQMALLASSNEAESIRVLHETTGDGDCLAGVMGLQESFVASGALKAQVLNTELRSRAWIAFNRHIGGEVERNVYPWEYAKECKFNLNEGGQ